MWNSGRRRCFGRQLLNEKNQVRLTSGKDWLENSFWGFLKMISTRKIFYFEEFWAKSYLWEIILVGKVSYTSSEKLTAYLEVLRKHRRQFFLKNLSTQAASTPSQGPLQNEMLLISPKFHFWSAAQDREFLASSWRSLTLTRRSSELS